MLTLLASEGTELLTAGVVIKIVCLTVSAKLLLTVRLELVAFLQ
jgi:hypothetical protein